MSRREPPDPDDPVQHYLKHLKTSGKSQATLRSYRQAFSTLQNFLDNHDYTVGEMTDLECLEYIKWLRSGDGRNLSGTSTVTYTSAINKFYSYFSRRGTFETNPMAIALEETEVKNDTDRHRRDLSVEKMRGFVRGIDAIQPSCMVTTFVKTGMRLSELLNLDLRDLYIDHEGARRVLPDPRPELAGKPDSIFIDSSINEGDVVNGDQRLGGNKRQRDTILPVDGEMKRSFLWWIAARLPSATEASPLFVLETAYASDRSIGERMTQNAASSILRKFTKNHNWYVAGEQAQTNVTPHYFRHFFTTHMRDRTNDRAFVQYIRGDTGNDAINDYIHNWGNMVRDKYNKNIYSVL